MPDTYPPDEIGRMTDTHRRAIIEFARSWTIHPDWDVDTHVSYLINDAFLADDPDDKLATYTGWPHGGRLIVDTIRGWVVYWLSDPKRTAEYTASIS